MHFGECTSYFRQMKKMGKEMIISEKTPTLQMSKTPFEYDSRKEKAFCSRNLLSWLLASILIILIILVCVLFWYPSYGYDQKIIIQEEPIEVRMISSTLDYAVHQENTPRNSMNPWDFEFLINPINLCSTINPPNSVEYQTNPEVKLLILVPSAADHFVQRNAIRNTWGSVANRPLGPMRLGFVLGTTTNKTVEDLIHEESSEFKDIIQIDIVDNYQHLTTKSILMLKWIAKTCPHAQYFLKTDDDTFVNMHNIANLLNKEPYISEDRFIGGHVKSIEPTVKTPEMFQKFHVTVDDYPPEDFPPYASSSYVMTIPTAIDLFGAAKEVEPHFPEDDAFLTGFCAKHLNIPLIYEPSFVIDNPPMPPLWDTYSTLSIAHSITPDDLEQVWNDMTKSVTNIKRFFEIAINTTRSLRKI